jgi:hypothetical protein
LPCHFCVSSPKVLDNTSFPTIMPVFVARRLMTFSRSADYTFHQKASHQPPLGAKVNHITHFFSTGD